MADQQASLVARYVLNCQWLRRDLSDLISDLEYQDRGGTVRYAIDFSEIFAYANPTDSADEFALFVDPNDSFGEVAQRLALEKLIYGMQHKPILLGEYAVELRSFLTHVRFEQLRSMLVDALEAEGRSAEDLLEQVDGFVQTLDLAGADVPQPALDEIAEFLKSKAGWLLSMIYKRRPEPVQRIRRVIDDQRFENLQALVDPIPAAAEADVDHWFDRLKNARLARKARAHRTTGSPVIASRLDAHAIATLQACARCLDHRHTRLVLVTRSSTMHRIVESGVNRGLGGPAGFLRHPRVFSVLCTVEGQSARHIIAELRDRVRSMDLFLRGVRSVRLKTLRNVERRAALEALLKEMAWLSDRFTSRGGLAASLDATAPSNAGADKWSNSPDAMRKLLRALRDRNELRQLLSQKVTELDAEWNRDHEWLGVFVPSSASGNVRVLEQTLNRDRDGSVGNWRVTMQGMPYELKFSDPAEVGRLLQALLPARARVGAYGDTLSKGGEGNLPDQERRLAFAYALAVLSEWDLAERYCEEARGIRSAGPSEHTIGKDLGVAREIRLLLAVCKRKRDPIIPRLKDGLELLEQAKRLSKIMATKNEDPRFLTEEATLILLLSALDPGPGSSSKYTPDAALATLDRAELMCAQDEQLRIQIVNNRLFYHISSGRLADRKRLERDYEFLWIKMAKTAASYDEWPPGVLDTLACARWMLFRQRDAAGMQLTIELLTAALRSQEIGPTDRSIYEARLNAVKRGEDIVFSSDSKSSQHGG